MKIKTILRDAKEEFALFHSYKLFKFDLNDRGNKLVEKDFIIVNYTHQYICGVEVKRTLKGPSKQWKGNIVTSILFNIMEPYSTVTKDQLVLQNYLDAKTNYFSSTYSKIKKCLSNKKVGEII